jgi:hypothetical protein
MEESLFDLGHDQPDLVHVGRQHDRRTWLCGGAALQGDDAAQGVTPRLVRVAPKLGQDNLAYLVLIPGDTWGL